MPSIGRYERLRLAHRCHSDARAMFSSTLTTRIAVAMIAASALLTACAPEITRRPVELTAFASDVAPSVITIQSEVTVSPSVAYPRSIKAGSQWNSIGTTPAGRVYRPASGVFTVEGAHVHEAALVIFESKIVGFYMLVEKAFVPLDPAVAVQLTTGGR